MRTSDPVFLHYVDQWWGVLLPRVRKYLYQNGGPIILVQLENEYGYFGLETGNCDSEYLSHLEVWYLLFFKDGLLKHFLCSKLLTSI